MIFPTISSWRLQLQKRNWSPNKITIANCHLKYDIPINTILKWVPFPVAIRDVSSQAPPALTHPGGLSYHPGWWERFVLFLETQTMGCLFIQVGCSMGLKNETSRDWSKLLLILKRQPDMICWDVPGMMPVAHFNEMMTPKMFGHLLLMVQKSG